MLAKRNNLLLAREVIEKFNLLPWRTTSLKRSRRCATRKTDNASGKYLTFACFFFLVLETVFGRLTHRKYANCVWRVMARPVGPSV